MDEEHPPLRVRESDGSPNVIPVYEIVLSGGTLTKTGPTTVRITVDSGGSASSVVYAATGAPYFLLSGSSPPFTQARILAASTGLTFFDLGAANTAGFSVNTNIRDKELGFFFSGAMSTTHLAEHCRIYIPFNMQLLQVRLAVQTAPTGESLIFNPLQYNATMAASTAIFATTDRPMIVAGASVGSDNGTIGIGNLYTGSWLGINVDQVGATNAGSGATVTLVLRSS